MSFLWFMAFDHLPTGTTGRAMAAGDGSLDVVGGSTAHSIAEIGGERGIRGTGADHTWGKNVPNLTELVVGFRFYNSTHASPVRGQLLLMSGTDVGLNIIISDTGSVSVRRDTTVLDADVATLAVATKYYVELSCKIDESDGDWTLKIDGLVVSSGSSANTGNAAITVVSGASQTTSGTGDRCWFAAMYIKERPPAELGFLGPLSFERLDPVADIAVQWTRDSGTDNYARVAGVADTDGYVDSDTLDEVDEYEAAALPPGANAIIAVARYSVSEAPDGGAPQIGQGLKRGTTEKYVTDPERTVGVSGPRTQITVHPTQPDGNPWSLAAVGELHTLLKSV